MTKKILLADDSYFMRSNLKEIVSEAGYEVIGEATNGQEAIEFYKNLKPDLLIMDIVMPQKSGSDALKDIIELDPDAKVVLCTAIDQQSILIDALKSGAKVTQRGN